MITVQILENDDTILPSDWCRPLELVSMSGGHSDSYSFQNCYSGTPENNVEWVRADAIFGEVWFTALRETTAGYLSKKLDKQYEFVRGDVPKSHRLNMKGYSSHAETIAQIKAKSSYIQENDYFDDDIPF